MSMAMRRPPSQHNRLTTSTRKVSSAYTRVCASSKCDSRLITARCPRTTRRPRTSRRRPTAPARTRRHGARAVGLALAGGGPLGAIWEIGALCALEEALVGVDFTRMDGYVGISAGGFIAA